MWTFYDQRPWITTSVQGTASTIEWVIYPPTDDPGTAGVREPRRPLPVLPSDAVAVDVHR